VWKKHRGSVCEWVSERERERKSEAVSHSFDRNLSFLPSDWVPFFFPLVRTMERYGRASEGSQSDPSPEWTVAGADAGIEGDSIRIICYFLHDFRFAQNNAECDNNGSRFDLDFAINAESSWQLGLAASESYPLRPDEADCIYYLRTGFCGYGTRCRFNHPRDRAAVINKSSSYFYFLRVFGCCLLLCTCVSPISPLILALYNSVCWILLVLWVNWTQLREI